jgi:hypothetical protein
MKRREFLKWAAGFVPAIPFIPDLIKGPSEEEEPDDTADYLFRAMAEPDNISSGYTLGSSSFWTAGGYTGYTGNPEDWSPYYSDQPMA